MTKQPHVFNEPRFKDQPRQRRTLRAIPRNQAAERESALLEFGTSSYEESVVLHRVKASDGEHEQR